MENIQKIFRDDGYSENFIKHKTERRVKSFKSPPNLVAVCVRCIWNCCDWRRPARCWQIVCQPVLSRVFLPSVYVLVLTLFPPFSSFAKGGLTYLQNRLIDYKFTRSLWRWLHEADQTKLWNAYFTCAWQYQTIITSRTRLTQTASDSAIVQHLLDNPDCLYKYTDLWYSILGKARPENFRTLLNIC